MSVVKAHLAVAPMAGMAFAEHGNCFARYQWIVDSVVVDAIVDLVADGVEEQGVGCVRMKSVGIGC